ncbi:M28 family peptidase [Nocardioides sp.]|uniref:M28 family metallopeptidase n=1 Tax=Nocardioides sp. TaxID=35761 RepID=UPI003014979B
MTPGTRSRPWPCAGCPTSRASTLLATPPGHPGGHQAGDVLLMAHLDTVRCSTGADDNASGVAVTLEVARQLRGRDHRVVIALVDLEELWHLGSRELARTLPRPGLVVCLDAVIGP